LRLVTSGSSRSSGFKTLPATLSVLQKKKKSADPREEELHEHPPDELDEPKEIDSEAGVMDEVSLDEEQEVDSGKKVPDDLAKEKEEV